MADLPKTGEPTADLPPEEMDQLVAHMLAEEVQSEDARLNSVESLQMWMMTHPALRQMAIVDSIAQIGPAILHVLRKLLGL